jgi:hypothetical protein
VKVFLGYKVSIFYIIKWIAVDLQQNSMGYCEFATLFRGKSVNFHQNPMFNAGFATEFRG